MRRAALLVMFAGCVHVPRELADARDDYAAAHPDAELGAARAALDLATYEYELNGDSQKARDLAYIARRRVDIANSKARKHEEQQALAAMKAELSRWKARQDLLRAEIEQQAANLPPVPLVSQRAH